jgi:Glycosyl hydrolase family 14
MPLDTCLNMAVVSKNVLLLLLRCIRGFPTALQPYPLQRSFKLSQRAFLGFSERVFRRFARWGICERHGPGEYDFTAYMELFKKAKKHNLKVQAVMSFHQGGGNVGDGSTYIPLPSWVQEVRIASSGTRFPVCISRHSLPVLPL